ncbi:hypothetical protein FQA39_LY10810 [Lamprigera yunnana]|nr:hypothetical protein FQA39_LY10810 [Lamprigera yunnana]
MTVRDAIASRILDVRTGKLVASSDGTQITIEEALQRDLVDSKIAERLSSPCGIKEDGHNLTLLEVIQREIYEAEQGFIDPSEKRIKVMQTNTIQSDDGKVDDYQLGSHATIVYSKHKEVKLKTGAVCLYDAINQGLTDERTGWIVDRNSGNKYQIDAAVKIDILDGNVQEIVDHSKDTKITLNKALEKGIINPKLGKYVYMHEKLPLLEAKRRQLIVKPVTLKDVCNQNLMDEEGKILSSLHQSKLTIPEAISHGILDSNTIKSIVNTKTGELITLNDALNEGIILGDNTFKDNITGEIFTIAEAVRRGYITSVTQKSIFDIDGFMCPDKSEFISFNAASAKGFISKKSGGSLVANLKSGKLISFADGIKVDQIKSEVYEMLNRKIGIFENGLELTVLEAVFKGYIDPKTGNFIDIHRNKIVPLNDAIAQNLITPEGAALLNSLLMIYVTTQTTCKVVQRYVTVTTSNDHYRTSKITYTEALQRGLIDNEHQTFTDPDTREVISVVQALNDGKLSPDTENISNTTAKMIHLEQQPMQTDHKYIKNETTSQFSNKESTVSSTEKQVFQLPIDGWTLSEAINQHLFDPVSGLFIIPGTDRLVSFKECINLKIINPSSALVVEPHTQQKIALYRSMEKNILDNTGNYLVDGKRINMKEAIEMGYIILEETIVIEENKQRLLQITKQSGKPVKVEVSHVVEKHPPTYTEIITTEQQPNYLGQIQLESGVIYDPSSSLIIYPHNNESQSLLEAIKGDNVLSTAVQIINSSTGAPITLDDAIQKGIIDKHTGVYTDISGNKIHFNDAVKLGVLTVIGTPIIAGPAITNVIREAQRVDPKTGEDLSLEVIYQRGAIEDEAYQQSKDEESSVFNKNLTTSITKYENLHQSTTTSSENIKKSYTVHEPLKTNALVTRTDEGLLVRPKTLSTTSISLNTAKVLSPGERTRNRITLEPKYTVSIGRAQSVSPDREAKRVVLQKLRKKIVKPKDAIQKGLIDQATAEILENRENFVSPEGEMITLQEAIDLEKVNGDVGKIIDPQRGDVLTVKEAISRGVLDPDGTNELLVPLNHSLSIPELFEQGLIEPTTNKVVHPETGIHLTIREGIICDIVDPLSILMETSGDKVTLEHALEAGTIDENLGIVKTVQGDLNIQTAVTKKIFDIPKIVDNIPPAGMTFPVAIKRGLVDLENKEVIHPITKERKALEVAIKDNFIMALPYPMNINSVEISEALNSNLINSDNGTFMVPSTGDVIPIAEAVETGLLIVKPLSSSLHLSTQPITTLTATVTSVHTVTTKTIELLTGYILIDTNQIQEVSTGNVYTLDEARVKGIIVDEKETKNTTTLKDIKMSFSDALNKGLVDMKSGTYTDPQSGTKIAISEALKEGILEAIPSTTEDVTDAQIASKGPLKTTELNLAEAFETVYDESTNKFYDPKSPEKLLTFTEAIEKEIIDANSIIYDVNSQKPITIEQAIDKGLIDSETGQVKDKSSGKSIDFKKAAKMGLIAIVGTLASPVVAPVIAGAAALKAIKRQNNRNKDVGDVESNKSDEVTEVDCRVITVTEKKLIVKDEKLREQEAVQTQYIETIPLEKIKLGDAIAQMKIEPKVCRIVYNDSELPYTVQDALEQSEVNLLDTIEVINKNKIVLLQEKPIYSIAISKELTPQKLTEMGCYDLNMRCFIHPETSERISFQHLIYKLQIFDADSILVKDLTKKPSTYVTLHEAFKRPLIDRNTGHMVDPKIGKRVPFFEAVKLKWIINTKDKPKVKYPQLSLEDIMEMDDFNLDDCQVIDTNTGIRLNLAQAIGTNIIDAKTLTIRDPKNMQIVPFYDAVDSKIVDMQGGLVINTITHESMPFPIALREGYLLTIRRPISLEAIIKKKYYDTESGQIIDPLTKQLIPIDEAVSRRIIDDKISQVKDVETNSLIPLDVALKNQIVKPDTGTMIGRNGQLVTLDVALQQNLIHTKIIIFNILQAILMNYYSPRSGLILNPMTGDEISIQKAIEYKLVDPVTTKIKDDQRKKILDLKDAIDFNLVDAELGVLTNPRLTLDQAYNKGYILSTVLPWSLQETLALKLYDSTTGQFEINSATLTLQEAIDENIINPNVLTVRDPQGNDIITLNDAIKRKLIDSTSGYLTDPETNLTMNFYEAHDQGLIIPYQSQLSLPEAVYKGYYDPKTGKFTNPKNKQKLKADKAIRRGYLDASTTLVTIDEDVYTFDEAIDDGIVDTERGLLIKKPNKTLNFSEAFERGLLIEVRTPVSLSEALVKIYDPDSGLFLDPRTGNYVTLIEAIEINLIDPDSVHVRDTRAGVWKKLTLIDAIHNHYVDGDTGKVKDFSKSEPIEFTLQEALHLNILIDNKAAISLQRAIHQGLYDESSGKIIDTNSGRKITLHESIRKFIINPLLLCYLDKNNGTVLNLGDACRKGIVDKVTGAFFDSTTSSNINLGEALKRGLIVDIETCNFELFEAIEIKVYDETISMFIHPVTGRNYTLKEACDNELINPLTSLVKNTKTNKYVKLHEAVESDLINDEYALFNLPNGKTLNLLQAKKRGLIVTSQKPLHLEDAITSYLYRPDSGKFVDPVTGEFYDLLSSLDIGLIHPLTTAFKEPTDGTVKSLRLAIRDGNIDIEKGRVFDNKTKQTHNFDKAFANGLLMTVEKPLPEDYSLTSLSPLIDQKVVRECPLEDAINFEFLIPDVAVVRDPQSCKFITVEDAIKSGLLDVNKVVNFNVQTGKVKCLIVMYENNISIYLKEPYAFEQALEMGYLDINTGKFTVPQSNEVLSLKDSISLGYIDSDTALVKDVNKKKLVKLPEAFRKGLVDAEKGSVLDSSTSKLHSLTTAIDTGLLVTPRRGFTLIESLLYAIYNPTTGGFSDPFVTTTIIDRKRLTLTDAITNALIDPSSTVIKDPESGVVLFLLAAIDNKIVDPISGRINDNIENKSIDFNKAYERGLILPAEQRQAVEEKYKLCDEVLTKLLKWIGEVEGKISSQSIVCENEEELRNQINTLKQVKDDLDQHASQVSHCGDQVRQLVLTGGDVLSKSEVSALEKSGRNLKSRYDKAVDRTDKLLRKLFTARDELFKLKGELNNFSSWLTKARRVLEDKECSLSDLHKLDSSTDSTKEFISDVIAHQADLRFITMATQKFFDESKEYLNVLNEFRTSLPSRLPHIEPLSSQESPVRNEVSYVTQQYRDLLHRANNLSDRLSGVGSRQRDYVDALDKVRQWMRDIEPKVNKVLNELISGDPRGVEEQLNRAKTLNNEFVASGRLIDAVKQALASLLHSLEGQLSPAEISRLEQPVIELDQKYKQLGNALAERCQELDTALVQSQGVQDALDGIVNWLNSAENQFKNLQRPASLIKDRLEEQLREHRVFQSDVDTHVSSIDSVYQSASELIISTSNARVAKQIETKLNDVKIRFEKLCDRTQKRGLLLEDIQTILTLFLTQGTQFEQWHSGIMEILYSRDFAKLSLQDYTIRINEIIKNRDEKRELFERLIQDGKDLVSKRDVTDTAPVRDQIKAIDNQWKELNSLLDEKQKLSVQRAEQLNIYEALREQVNQWLVQIEYRIAHLDTLAIDMETLKYQSEQLKPIAKEYRDYAITIDKVNDIGNSYDNLVKTERPESPSKKRPQAYSPTKRTTPLRRGSQDGRSPSPNKIISAQSPLSPGGSSGFSSRRSSQDGFHIEELSPIQQQLSEINNRYSLLGIKISDRQSEIDSLREELKKHLDNLKILDSFLDKVQRQLPKGIVPNTKEEADKAVRQIRHVIEELYEKQSLLDSTRTQVKDLLKRKIGALGADNLHDELEDVVSRWKLFNDKCKDRIKFVEDMKEFIDTHDSMSSWLSAKEKMLTVLGPISSDSRMVQSQVQQVQVLREEFRSQQPQLQHLIDVGDSVLTYLGPQSPEGHSVNTKLTNIQQRWTDVLGKLDARADSLGAAADTSREFDAQFTRLRDGLQAISDNLDDLPLDKDPEEQLRKIENLERQLEGQRPLLADLETAGTQLCNVLSDPASRTDIQAKLGSVGRQYNTLQKKLDHKKAEIEGALRESRQFEASCAKTLGWLSDELGSISERLLVSADRDVLEQQLAHHEPIYRDVLSREHEVIMLLNKGRDIIVRNNKTDSRVLQRDIDKIQQQWDKLRKETVDRQTRLLTCMEHCRKYYLALETFLPWLRQSEDKLDSLKPSSFKRKHIEKQLKDLQSFRNDVWKKSGEYENTRSLGDTFHSACDIDKDVVKNELYQLKERWDKLNNDLIARTQALEDQSRKLSDFNENLRELQHGLERCEDKLASHDALGGVAHDPKLLDRVKTLRDEVGKLKKPHQGCRQQAVDLVNEAAENSIDANHLQDEVDGLGDRITELQSKLDDRCSDLQSAATAVTQFNDQVKALTNNLSALESELDSMKPAGREFKIVRAQIDDVGKLINKINKTSDDVKDAVYSGERLVDSGFAPDTIQTRQQVESLQKLLGKLDERARNREQNLESTLKKLEDFYLNHASVLDNINDSAEQLHKMKPVASEVEAIRSQQQDFKKFRSKCVEPLTKLIDDCNRFGQGLIQSASSGVNTTILEKDLEKMNEQWNNLKEKINDRERRLDIALLQSGKFQEALDGLAKWLTDTEELVVNQKPPSADYKVVKAQLQEQKFLKKMLLDRQNSMSSLFSMGNEIAKEAEPKERKAIEKQLKDLITRFDALTEGAQQRTLDLERAMHVAKQFQDQLVPLQDWLDRSERKVKDMELIPTDEEKIQQRIREHDILHNDILDKKPDFSELTDIASNLMALVGDDEASTLADKLQDVTDRYGNLVETSDQVGQLLTMSRQGLRHLVLTYQDLASWMDEMERQLSRYKILAVHTDRLLEQMDDLANLTENISSRQQDVDGTVDAGVELMRHISSDEALQLKDKLDSLQRRYNELTSRGADLLKNAQDLLPLVQQFHNNHSCLSEWMKVAENVLQSAETDENEITKLELDLQEQRPVLEAINLYGPQLCQASPGEGAATIEGLVTRDNRRFDAIAEQIQRRAERIHLGKQRALEVTGDIDELLEWFREVESQIRDAEKPSAEPDLIRVQLKEHKALNDDISSQKGRVRDVLATSRKVLRESPPSDDMSFIREKMEDLRETMDTVSTLSSDRLGILEQALPLAEHFHDTHAVLSNWLNDMEEQISMLAMPAMRPDLIAQQQDRNELFVQSINEHKPLVDKLNKTGEALIKLCNDDDGSKVQEFLDSCNERYAALKLELRERQQALEKALQESSKFADKLEGMLRALSNAADQVHNQDPISAHSTKIRDQIEDNNALVGDLDKRKEAYAAVQRAADDVINKAGNRSDPAIKDVKRKLEKLKNLWEDIQKASNDRGLSLEDALDAAEKFWSELHAVMVTLHDLEDSLSSQEPPAVEPKAIQQQQVALQEIRQEIDQTKPEVDQVRASGQELMQLCGEPDKPEVKKHIEDLDHAWDNITALYAKREENLIDAMEKAMEFHETLQNLMVFLNDAEKKFVKMGPLGTDIDAVKKQIEQLKDFKSEVDPHMVKVEALNRQAQELTERTSADQAASIKEPLAAVNRRWDDLLRGVIDRQRQLENALLRLGQFQHALNELLVWISKTDQTLDELKPVAGDPQILEIELAKLKVLVNDIQAHQTSIDTLNDAGRQIIESGKGTDEAGVTQEKLNTLNIAWRALMQKAADRQRELEIALREAQHFNAEIQDLLSWLGDVDGIIAASKPVGGLPETASEQLERFMEIYNELEDNRPKVETVLAQGQEYLRKGSNAASNLQHNLRTLKQRWDSVTSRANDKKIKLEIALKEATEFHDALQAFVNWLTNAEKILSNLKSVSRVLETVQNQIEEHKMFQKDVSAHRETMLNLDKKGTHLKYFSQKQDVILIKNLLISVQHRWERVASKSAERTRALDLGYKEAKEFHDLWYGLMKWLEETEISLDDLLKDAMTNDPDKIKQRLAKHQEFQRVLSSKQSNYDNTMKMGKLLKEKAPKTDETIIKQMLVELKNKWTIVCNKSIDRQRKLEEALLYSGQFKDAIAALLQWLKKAKTDLSLDEPLHGDLDTVNHLIDQHRHFEQELESRNAQMETVMRTGHELEVKANKVDASTIRTQLTELNTIWETVSELTHRKSAHLDEALKEAEKLHKAVHMLLDWLSDAEMKLRFAGNAPEDEETAYAQLEVLEKIRRELHDKELEKDNTLTLAHNVLAKAHSDAVNVIKHWITIIQSRWEEVSQWAQQRHKKLSSHIQSLKDLDQSLEELLAWLQGLENTLLSLRQEDLPMDIPSTEDLIADHKEFMENTQKRQLEVDKICKAKQVKPVTGSKDQKKLIKNKTPIRGSQHDVRETSPDGYGTLGRKQRCTYKFYKYLYGNMLHVYIFYSRTSPGREFSPDPNIPHIGPRFPTSGSIEPEFRSPRVKYLWDKWRNVWMLEWERQRLLYDHLAYLKEKERADNFSWDDWRRRFLKFMNHKKSRLTDLFRKMDKDNNGLIPRDEFIEGIIKTKFDTSRLEMKAVADMFDRNNCGLIDWKEFIAALRPDWQEKAPDTDAQKIHDEVKRLVMLCTCRLKFKVFQVGEGKYRFGDSQKLRLVRILRSTVMVRVGGGWVALDEFLLKNDPCRVTLVLPLPHPDKPEQHEPWCFFAKGRTNIELREQFILADGVSQSMTAFKPKTSASTPGSGSSANSLRTPTAGPITKVRERSVRSTPMSSGGATRTSKSSLGTPESLSDTEGPSLRTPRKPSYRSTLTPGGSRPSSRPASRTGSRPGSKPPSRHGSNLSLDSTDDGTPSRIPTRRTPMSGRNIPVTSSTAGKKPTPHNGLSSSRPRTPTGLLSPTSSAGREPGEEYSEVQQFITDILFYIGNCYSCLSPCEICSNLNLRDVIKRYRRSCDSLIKTCKWNGVPFDCCEKFLPLNTEYGLCFSINSLHTNSISGFNMDSNRETGPGELYIEAIEDIRIYFHAPEDVPFINTNSDQRKDIVVGDVYNISINVIFLFLSLKQSVEKNFKSKEIFFMPFLRTGVIIETLNNNFYSDSKLSA